MTQQNIVLAVVGIAVLVGVVKWHGVKLADGFVVSMLVLGSVAILVCAWLMPLR